MLVQSTGCVFAYFLADTKIICGYNFVAPLTHKTPGYQRLYGIKMMNSPFIVINIKHIFDNLF